MSDGKCIKYRLTGTGVFSKPMYAGTWEQAAELTIKFGWAVWHSEHELKLKPGVEIKAVRT